MPRWFGHDRLGGAPTVLLLAVRAARYVPSSGSRSTICDGGRSAKGGSWHTAATLLPAILGQLRFRQSRRFHHNPKFTARTPTFRDVGARKHCQSLRSCLTLPQIQHRLRHPNSHCNLRHRQLLGAALNDSAGCFFSFECLDISSPHCPAFN
jgi:hypothetical protein